MRRQILITAVLLATSSAAAAAHEQPICADRPSKSTGPCTVPVGHWQLETGLVDWTSDKSGGVRTDAVAWGNTSIKYGLSNKADIELLITPLETLLVRGNGMRERNSSFGDMLVRVKYALTPGSAPIQVALDPFVKLPTANHMLGNGKVEAGLLVPVQVPIAKTPLTLCLDPELDLNADADGSGRHLATQQVINIGVAASEKVSLSTEIWTKWDWDPAGIGKQVSWDIAAAYLPTKRLQLDAGANFGLNSQTSDVEVYAGVSTRF